MRKRTLAEWKGIYVTWRNIAARVKKNKWLAVRYRNNAKLAIRRLEAGILVCLALAILIGGCCTMTGAGKDVQRLSDGWMQQQNK